MSLFLLTGCSQGEHRAAREKFNEGVAALAKGDFEDAEKKLTEARSDSGVDPELRFRAAYDLGLAYAGHADKARGGEQPDLEKALDLAQHAASWFADAARLRKDDADTQANLAIVRARVQAISDELHKGEGKLEKRLDALIAEQRGILEDARGAWLAIKRTGGADPLGQQGTLTHLADRERGVVAEAGVIGDLAADETSAIEAKKEEERSDEERSRIIQLANLNLYIQESRARIGEARRKLQELAAEEGVARAEAALTALKRAREQLLDPITVLRGVAQEEMALVGETMRAAGGATPLGAAPKTDEPLPVWLEPPAIGERQAQLRERVEEVRARLTAFVEHKAEPSKEEAEDAKRTKLLARVTAALPPVADASASMQRANESLAARDAKAAIPHEEAALDALARAIEEFADLKGLVEIAHAQQQEVSALLSAEAAKELEPAERAKRTKNGIARNTGRMPRLAELISDAVAELEAKAKEPQPPADPKDDAAKEAAEEAKRQADAEKQRLALAENLRAEAQAALASLDRALAENSDPLPPARQAAAKIEELRKLFFSVIEHLEQLIRDQGETKDQTSAAQAEEHATREPKLAGIQAREEDHGRMATAITEALAKEADASHGKPQQQGGPDPKALSAAVEEMRQAQLQIGDASSSLAKAKDPATASDDLTAAGKSQDKALEHLVEARRLLDPPKQENDQQDEPQEGGESQPEPKRDEQQQQAGGAAQRARDEDARRQRERQARAGQPAPVEKDW